jgi:hypothetical protein
LNKYTRIHERGGQVRAHGDREPKGAEDSTSSLEVRKAEVQKLARRFTERSSDSATGQSPFAAKPGSTVDPNGEHFNAHAWCKAMLLMYTEDSQEVLGGHSVATVACKFVSSLPVTSKQILMDEFQRIRRNGILPLEIQLYGI